MTPAGMIPPDPDSSEWDRCHDWLVFASAAHRGQAYLRWQLLRGIGEFLDLTLANLYEQAIAGNTELAPFDAYTVAIAEVQVLFGLRPAHAKALVEQATSATDRIPVTAALLRDCVISPDMFAAVVARTDIIIDPQILKSVDIELAAGLRRAGDLSVAQAERHADRVVARHDADAVRRRREKARTRRNVTVRDYRDGLAGINITATPEEAQLALAAVDALAAGVCGNDPRPIGVRRSDAALARLRGEPFTCACEDKTTCTATLSEQEISGRQARIVIHAVCQKSTIDGVDDEPGYLDGHGVVTADHLREIAERPDATVRDLDLDQFANQDEPIEHPLVFENTAQPADPYRPTSALDALIRGLFMTCTTPGCERPAWNCELDHVEEYPSTELRAGDQFSPESGGPTCICNLNPKCKGCHLRKTHLGTKNPAEGFLDDQWIEHGRGFWSDGTVWTSVTTPHGMTTATAAPGQWLVPQLWGANCVHRRRPEPHSPPDGEPPPGDPPQFEPTASPGGESLPGGPPLPEPPVPPGESPGLDRDSGDSPSGGGLKAAAAHKRAWRRRERARLARERRRYEESDGPPPF